MQLPVDEGADAARIAKAVKRVVFVGTPNYGTSLGESAAIGARAADLLINMVHVDALGLYGKLSGFLARLAVAEAGSRDAQSGFRACRRRTPPRSAKTIFWSASVRPQEAGERPVLGGQQELRAAGGTKRI